MIWLTRGKNPKLNRDNGLVCTGDYTSLTDGPDGVADSAMRFDGTDELVAKLTSVIDGDFTMQFGYRLPTTPADIPVDSDPVDVSAWEDMDQIGGPNTFIAINKAEGRFEFVINGTARAWLKSGAWENVEPAPDPAAVDMGPYFDQDRSCWVFLIGGTVAGVVDGNTQASNFLTALPGAYAPTLFSYIKCDDDNERMEFWTMTTNETSPRMTGYIDTTGYHNGAIA
jgi:hypothetical protein